MSMFLLALLISYGLAGAAKGFMDEDSLVHNLTTNYNKKVSPGSLNGHTTVVKVSVQLYFLSELRDKEQQIAVSTSFKMEWFDQRLRWNTTTGYSNIQEVMMSVEDVWVPTIGHHNSVDGPIELKTDDSSKWIIVMSNGTVRWDVRANLMTPCKIDAACFPFDIQKCQLKFAALRHSDAYLQLDISRDVGLGSYIPHSEWDLAGTVIHGAKLRNDVWEPVHVSLGMKTNAEDMELPDKSPGLTRSGFILSMTYRRRHHYYLFSVIAPGTLVSVLILLVFYLPLDAGERMSFSVTIFLTFSLFQVMVTDRLPNASGSTSILGIYLFLQMVLSAVSVVVSVVVMNIHYVYSQGSRMPKWLRRLLLDWLAACIHMRRTIKESTNNNSIKLKIADNREKSMILRHHRLSEPVPPTDTAIMTQQNRVSDLVSAVHKVLREVKSISRRGHQVEASEKVNEEWRFGAMVIDRLMMVFCGAAVMTSTFVCFFIIPSVHKDICA